MQIIPAERRAAVLTPSNLPCLSSIPTVNLTAGCAHGCLYCYAKGYATHPGDGRIRIYTNTLTRLRDELDRRRAKPRVVYFSPSSDLFQPVPQVLDLAYDVLRLLFERRIGVALLTKGRIPERHMRLLEASAPLVCASVGITTTDPHVARLFEPGAPPPSVRIMQAAALTAAGIPTQIRLDPILPGLTDDPRCFEDLCALAASAGVRQMAASTLFLRPAIARAMRLNLADDRLRERVLGPFSRGVRLAIYAEHSHVYALPRASRNRIHTDLRAAAARHGVAVRVCACKNPDLAAASCRVGGTWKKAPSPIQQEFPWSDVPRGVPPESAAPVSW